MKDAERTSPSFKDESVALERFHSGFLLSSEARFEAYTAPETLPIRN